LLSIGPPPASLFGRRPSGGCQLLSLPRRRRLAPRLRALRRRADSVRLLRCCFRARVRRERFTLGCRMRRPVSALAFSHL